MSLTMPAGGLRSSVSARNVTANHCSRHTPQPKHSQYSEAKDDAFRSGAGLDM